MKKSDFAEELAKKCEVHVNKANEIIDAFWEIVVKAMKKGDEVVFPHGKFVLVKRPAREGRNPFNGEAIKIPAKVVPQFKPGKKFKDDVAKK